VPRYEAPDPEVEIARARRTVGTTPAARVRWLLRFASLQLDKIDLRPVRYEWSVFYEPEREQHPSIGEDEAEQELTRLQDQVRSGLRRLQLGKGWSHKLVTYLSLWMPRAEHWIGGTALQGETFIEPKEPHQLHSARHESQRVSHVIARLLEAVGPKLRRCALPGCLTLFVQQGRQRFCTTTHAARYRTRKRRGTLPVVPTGPDARLGARHVVPWVERQKQARGWARSRGEATMGPATR
jgi:hypothetical protein